VDFLLTDEQYAIVERSHTNTSFAVKAFAGTGKTSTATAIVEANPGRRFLYLAFGKRVADEARLKFPEGTTIKTAHALAFGPVGRHYAGRLTNTSIDIKRALAPAFERGWDADHGNPELAFYALLGGLNAFMASDDRAIAPKHFEKGPYDTVQLMILARTLWDEMVPPAGSTPITHDFYLKLWQLGQPYIAADTIIFDEAQDASPAMLDIVLRSGIPTIFLGDPWQSIFAFRGAIDAFERLGNIDVLPLTASWRFGAAVAEQANRVLAALGEKHPLQGLGPHSTVTYDPHPEPTTIVARTTQGLVEQAVAAIEEERTIHVVGGTEQIFDWILAAYDMKRMGYARHPQFRMFTSFAELKEVSEQPIGKTFAPYVRLVESYDSSIPDVLQGLNEAHRPPNKADVILASAHRFKGQEGDVVRAAGDFQPFATLETDPRTNRNTVVIDRQEANLSYVTLTRARKILDLSLYHTTLNDSLALISKRDAIEVA
jgi:hypothetical protein